jgi:hypothetical protein
LEVREFGFLVIRLPVRLWSLRFNGSRFGGLEVREFGFSVFRFFGNLISNIEHRISNIEPHPTTKKIAQPVENETIFLYIFEQTLIIKHHETSLLFFFES